MAAAATAAALTTPSGPITNQQFIVEAIRRGNLNSVMFGFKQLFKKQIPITLENTRLFISTAIDPGEDFRNNEQFETNQLDIMEYLLKKIKLQADDLDLVHVGDRATFILRSEPFRKKQQKLYRLLLENIESRWLRYVTNPDDLKNIIGVCILCASFAGCDDLLVRFLERMDDYNNTHNNTFPLDLLQLSLSRAANNGYVSIMQILLERCNQSDGRNTCFHFTDKGIFLPVLQRYVRNGNVVKYLLSTATEMDTIDGMVQRNPQTNTLLLITLVRQMMDTNQLHFPSLLVRNIQIPNNFLSENVMKKSISDNVDGLLYIFNYSKLSKMMVFKDPIDPTNQLSLPTLAEHRQIAIRYGNALQELAEFDQQHNNSECRSDIIRLMYAIVFHGKRVPKTLNNSIVPEIVPAVDFSFLAIAHKKWFRSYILLDIELMLSELCARKYSNEIIVNNSMVETTLSNKQDTKTVVLAMNCLHTFDLYETAKSKQAIMLRYFNRMFDNPEEQFPRALTVDELVLLSSGNQFLNKILQQRDPFRIVTILEDQNNNMNNNVASTSSSSSSSSNTTVDANPTL